jgi:hypothetical protein
MSPDYFFDTPLKLRLRPIHLKARYAFDQAISAAHRSREFPCVLTIKSGLLEWRSGNFLFETKNDERLSPFWLVFTSVLGPLILHATVRRPFFLQIY